MKPVVNSSILLIGHRWARCIETWSPQSCTEPGPKVRRWNLDVNRCVRGRWPRQNREELANIPSIPRLDRQCCHAAPTVPLSASEAQLYEYGAIFERHPPVQGQNYSGRKSALFCSHPGRMPLPLPRDWRSMACVPRQGVIGSCIPSMPTSLLVQAFISTSHTSRKRVWSLTFCK